MEEIKRVKVGIGVQTTFCIGRLGKDFWVYELVKNENYYYKHCYSLDEANKYLEKTIKEILDNQKSVKPKEKQSTYVPDNYEEEYKAVGNIVYQRDYLVGIYEYRYSKIHKKCETEEQAIELAKKLNDKYNSEIHTDVMHGLIVKEEYTDYKGEICWR